VTWFRVDDRLGQSRKVLSIRRSMRLQAVGLWALAGAWSAGEELDGFVPEYMVEELGGDEDLAAALVASGLWETEGDGYQFANWGEWQPTREELDAKRAAERDRKAAWRAKKAEKDAARNGSRPADVPSGRAEDETGSSRGSSPVLSHGTTDGTTASESSTSALTRPDPTRPGPTTIKNSSSGAADAAPRPDVEALLDLLDEGIVANGGRAPTRNKANRDAMRLLIDKDGKTPEKIAAAIRWCQADEFWRANVLSASKLREKYEQLRLNAQRSSTRTGSRAEERQASNLSVVERMAALDAADQHMKGLEA